MTMALVRPKTVEKRYKVQLKDKGAYTIRTNGHIDNADAQVTTHLVDLGEGWQMSKSTISECDHVVNQIKGNEACINMIANILPKYPLPGPWGGSKGQNLTFSEHYHVAYQIKGNDKCSKMQAHILSLHVPSNTGVGVKVQNISLNNPIIYIYQKSKFVMLIYCILVNVL